MKILLIITPWIPAQTPNTLRWLPLVEHFIEQGIELTVLTTHWGSEDRYEKVDGYTIYRAGYNTLLDRLYDLIGKRHRRSQVAGASGDSPRFFVKGKRLIDKFWRDRYWPDGSMMFIKPAINSLHHILKTEKCSHLISVGLPFSSHLIAQAAKEMNSSLHWHMDIQDPFAYSKEFRVNNYKKYKEKNLTAERIAFAKADSISVTNRVARDKYLQLFGDFEEKLSTIPPLAVPLPLTANAMIRSSVGKIDLAYAGSFYEGVRSPKFFLDFLSLLLKDQPELFGRLCFHFIGQIDPISQSIFNAYPTLTSHFQFYGFQSREDTLRSLQEVDFVMNFGNTTDYHLPSKVVDLLLLGKPVINFVTIAEDSTKRFLQQYALLAQLHLNINANSNQESLKDFIAFIQETHQTTVIPISGTYDVSTIYEAYIARLQKSI